MVIDVENVSWRREQREILRNVTWKVNEGENWAILGLNGSGKTTLLQMITGYLWPTKGQVSVLGHRFGTVDLRELRREIGWVSSSLLERVRTNETAENLVQSGKYATMALFAEPNSADRDRAVALLERFRCAHLIGRPFVTFSQGEKQKVLIARALMAHPRVLILDEPCTGLDIFAREQLLASIAEIGSSDAGPTLLYVTHHIEEIIPVFSHALLIQSGGVYAAGPTREVITSPRLSDFFQTVVEVLWSGERASLRVHG